MIEFEFTAPVFVWQGKAAWHFIALPEGMRAEVDKWCHEFKAGFGSIRVEATIGETTWKTSIFPDNKRDTYLLPLNAAVRKAESLTAGDEAAVHLAI